MPSRTRAVRGVVLCALLLPAACRPVVSPSPSTDSSTAPTGATIVVGLTTPPTAVSPFVAMTNGYENPPSLRGDLMPQLMYNGLYRYDDSLSPVPDLAAEPCEIAADQVTIRCRLVEARFHDGTSLTADDVVFTYELARLHPECVFGTTCRDLASVVALDERTVEFRLTGPNATFLTLALPTVLIDSRAVVEAAYAPLAERASTLAADDFQAAAAAIRVELEAASPQCEAPLPEAERLLRTAGLAPPPRRLFTGGDGKLDSCLYAGTVQGMLEDVEASLGLAGLEAISAAYQALPFNWNPVGTGPWRFVAVEDGTRAVLEAFADYHHGAPATPRLEVQVIRDEAAALDALVRGEITWLPARPEAYATVKDERALQFATYPDASFYMLAYNVREGMLFADRNLRTAVELCIDKPATVDAATDGAGDPIYSPIDPISWAYEEDLVRPARDVDAARRLIEESGWTPGADTVYMRDGERLATEVLVRSDEAQRVAFMDLVAAQVFECGIELTVVPADIETVLGPLAVYPHIPGGRDEPFEAVFVGWAHGFDPHEILWHSDAVSSETSPDDHNFMGFSNERVDGLIDEAIRSYDQRERARIYLELQRVLAEERPVLFAWADRAHEGLDARLRLTEGDLNLASRQWMWELEKLVVATRE